MRKRLAVGFVAAGLTLGLAPTAMSAPNPDRGPGSCFPPGQGVRELTPNPNEEAQAAGYRTYGNAVATNCAPGHN